MSILLQWCLEGRIKMTGFRIDALFYSFSKSIMFHIISLTYRYLNTCDRNSSHNENH